MLLLSFLPPWFATMKISFKMLFATLSGVFLEYFDYTLYGFSAPFIAHQFFPAEKPQLELLLTWAVFAISFLVRPLGTILFGHLADRFGRRQILIITIVLMSISTIGIGALPSYHHIGVIAPIALIACRILQGLAVSTEYSGCSTYLMEFIRQRRGLLSGIITSASGFGVFAASLLVLLFNALPAHLFWLANWRWPFIFAGVVVGLLGLLLRLNLTESPEFLQIKQQQQILKVPLWHLLREQPKALLQGIIVSAAVGSAIILIEIYLPTYLQTELHFSEKLALALSTFIALFEACLAIACGLLSDILGKVKTIFIGMVLMLLSIIPCLLLFHVPSTFIWFLAATWLALLVALGDGPIAAFLTQQFNTNVRYSGVSICYNIGAGIFGGFGPSVVLFLQHRFGWQHSFGYYLMTMALVCGFICFKLLHRHQKTPH